MIHRDRVGRVCRKKVRMLVGGRELFVFRRFWHVVSLPVIMLLIQFGIIGGFDGDVVP